MTRALCSNPTQCMMSAVSPMNEPAELLIASDVAIADRASGVAPRLGLVARIVPPRELAQAAAGNALLALVAVPGSARESELAWLKQMVRSVDAPIVVLGPRNAPGFAHEVLMAGAAELIQEPVSDEELLRALERCLAVAGQHPERAAKRGTAAERLAGNSAPMQRVMELIERAAPGNATVLVRGESGTGKELAALAVHELSARSSGPFVKVHCAALPEALLESELFGYEKGAFTGATARKSGRVELAAGGSLFLDEIGDISLAMQVKLLRLLQDRRYERLGSNEPQQADVRFIAATHRDLGAMVKSGEFREDLFYRLNVVTLWLPPLRARREDIADLALRFARESGEANGKAGVRLSDEALALLRSMRWPGNARQLQNLVERLIVFADGPEISKDDVMREYSDEGVAFATQPVTRASPPGASSVASALSTASSLIPVELAEELRRAERRALERALAYAQGNRSLAARVLGVSRATLYNKLADHGLS
ncbi:MAG TPA: sigma-54 dependent transcriptional regulator [Polyangiaceae bacterium]|nr:sigma-54 dependent transcriptional regulator [Polyangiaceae bacterium]